MGLNREQRQEIVDRFKTIMKVYGEDHEDLVLQYWKGDDGYLSIGLIVLPESEEELDFLENIK